VRTSTPHLCQRHGLRVIPADKKSIARWRCQRSHTVILSENDIREQEFSPAKTEIIAG
jgi:hypothetical protein